MGSDAHMRTQLVVCSHGKYAEGLVAASEMILGPVEGVLMYGLMPGVSPDVWREQIAADFTRVSYQGEVRFLVLGDLFGGSPCSAMIPLMHSFEIDIVTGLNLGMFLEVYSSLGDKDVDLAQLAQDTYQNSCVVLRSSDFRE